MPLLKSEVYTLDDIYALPEGQRAELIDGKMYMMASPSTRHQTIAFSVARKNCIKTKIFACHSIFGCV